MKILDIPQSGKRGRTVSQDGAFGQVSRTLVIPQNPRTEAQLNRRQVLGMLAHNWRTIAEASRVAWNEAGRLVKSAARLGQSGPLSGFLLFVKVNCNLELVGAAAVELPPAVPAFAPNVVKGLELTNAGGVVAIKLTCAGTSPAFNLVWGTPPKSAGRFRPGDYYYLGVLPAVVGGRADITALYTAKFGVPAAGQKVFVRSKQVLDGYNDQPHQWSGIVPAAG